MLHHLYLCVLLSGLAAAWSIKVYSRPISSWHNVRDTRIVAEALSSVCGPDESVIIFWIV
jgi:hypothetical protein